VGCRFQRLELTVRSSQFRVQGSGSYLEQIVVSGQGQARLQHAVCLFIRKLETQLVQGSEFGVPDFRVWGLGFKV